MRRADKSTNDRSTFRRSAADVLLRAGFGALARTAPRLAARAAARFFLRVPRVPRPRGAAKAFLASGDAFAVDGGRGPLAAWSYGRGPAVLLVHGWGGRGAQMRAFVPPLVAAGYRAIVFDGPAHGASRGGPASLPAFAAAIAAVARATDARAVIAHSMGGAATLVALSRGLALRRAVVLGAPASATRIWEGYRRALDLPEDVSEVARRLLEARVGTELASLDAANLGPRLTTPILAVHDLEDREIPWSAGEEIARVVPSARLETTRGLGHRRILRDPRVLARAVSWLAEDVAPARCAACGKALGTHGTDRLCGSCVLGRELFERNGRFAA